MRVVKSVSLDDVESRGSIKDGDVYRLLRALSQDPQVREDDVLALFDLNASCPVQVPRWQAFLVDVTSDYVVSQWEPAGYITSGKADWLINRLAVDGKITRSTEFDILRSVMARARWVPLSLACFTLNQVLHVVETGLGPTRVGQPIATGTINELEIELVRQTLSGFAADSSLALTRPELDILMRIDRALSRDLAPRAWTDLYVKALANALLVSAGFSAPDRHHALRAEVGPMASTASIDEVALSLAWVKRDYARQSSEQLALARLERQRIEIVTQEEFYDAGEAKWISDRLMSEHLGALSAVECAVVNHLRREGLLSDTLSKPDSRNDERSGPRAA